MAYRIKAFVDYWNFQLSLNQKEAASLGQSDSRFEIDWPKLGIWLAKKASDQIRGASEHDYEGAMVYTSYNPKTDAQYHRWATTWLDRQPGITVNCRERKPKKPPKCPSCHQSILNCPQCSHRMMGTVEKGVDTLIATDMIRLAWGKSIRRCSHCQL